MHGDFDAFVSHSSADAATAHKIVETLEAKGVRCWMAPRDIRPGLDFQQEIVTALESVRCLILLFSSKANESEHVHREVLLADNAKTPVYPVRIEDVMPSGAMKYQLANRQWLDFFDDRNAVLDALVGRIAQRRSVMPVNPANVPAERAAAPQLPPAPPPEKSDIAADDGVRRWLPPALDPAYLLFQFKGRIGRRSYFFGIFLTTLLPFLLFMWLAAMLAPIFQTLGSSSSSQMASAISLIGVGLIFFVYLYCSLSLLSKRLHDFGLSAWWSVMQVGPAIVAALSISFINMSNVGRLEQAFSSGESVYDKIAILLAILSTAVSTGFAIWLLFWPGQSTRNKFGPAPSFSRAWRPFDALVQRASARSEFDVPFVILSTEGRLGPKGLATGLFFLLWLLSAIWFFKVVYNGELSPLNFDGRYTNEFMGPLGIIGMTIAGLFFLVVFSCIVTKRLHDIGWSAWLQTIFFVGIVVTIGFLESGGPTETAITTTAWFALAFGILFAIPGAKDFNAFGPPPGFRVEALREQKQ